MFFRRRLDDWIGAPEGGELGRLRRQHSGQIGDYVAWATVGFALLGGLFAVAT